MGSAALGREPRESGLPPQLGTAALVQRLLVMPRSEDAGKKVEDRKRLIITDTLGLLVGAAIHPGDVQDRDGSSGTH
jgi:hypothetical protein